MNNGFYTSWSPSLTEIRAVVGFVELLMRNRDWQFINLSIVSRGRLVRKPGKCIFRWYEVDIVR